MIDVGDTLGRKIGPLPVWAWGGVVGGGILVVRAMSGGGASSPFVQPIATPDGMNFEPGGGAGGGETPAPWYAQIPGVGTIIDRPPGQVTVIPPTGSTPSTPSTQRLILTIKSRTSLFSNPLKPHDFTGSSGSYVVQKVSIGGKQWYKIIGTASGAPSSRIGLYVPFYANPTMYSVAQGDTTYAIGDATPQTPQAIVPSMPPVPLGTGIAALYPMLDRPSGLGPSIDAVSPIPSSARIAMPSFTGPTGSIPVPKVPYPSARAGRFDPSRFGDALSRAVDGWRPRVPPTTVRLPVNPLTRWQERLTARRSASG